LSSGMIKIALHGIQYTSRLLLRLGIASAGH
jgi:hypothetical protein